MRLPHRLRIFCDFFCHNIALTCSEGFSVHLSLFRTGIIFHIYTGSFQLLLTRLSIIVFREPEMQKLMPATKESRMQCDEDGMFDRGQGGSG